MGTFAGEVIVEPSRSFLGSGEEAAVDPSTRLSTFPLRLPLRTAASGHKANTDQVIEDGSLIKQYM
jgi:hypothetical protein